MVLYIPAAASAPPAGPHGGTSRGLRRGPPVAPCVEVHSLCDKPYDRGPQRRPPRQGPVAPAWEIDSHLITILVLFSLVLAGEGRKILESAGVSTSLALMLFGSHRT